MRVPMTRLSLKQAVVAVVAFNAAAYTAVGSAATSKFFNDDPVWVERDSQDASGMKPLEVDLGVDLIYNFVAGRSTAASVRAKNLNTVEEVPDSSWFTNRAGHRSLTTSDIAKGPDTTSGPVPGPWTVTSS